MSLSLTSESLVLGIETSCDETAAAVVRGGREILSNVVASQEDLHAHFGGIVPEVASRKHAELVTLIVEQALAQAGAGWQDLSLIAVTRGPGLVGSLLVGVSAAKGYSLATGLPLVGVDHIAAHVHSCSLVDHGGDDSAPEQFPALCLVASGGHSDLVLSEGLGQYDLVGGAMTRPARRWIRRRGCSAWAIPVALPSRRQPKPAMRPRWSFPGRASRRASGSASRA